MSLPLNKVVKEEGNVTSERNNCKEVERCGDILEEDLLRSTMAAEQVVNTASLIFASVFVEGNWSEGYHWVQSQIKGTHESLANRIKIEQAAKHLKRK